MTYKRRYKNQAEQYCYMNACDCLYYGYGFNTLNTCGIEKDKAKQIWKQAKEDMGNS